jgi:hypothetical protein
MAELHIFMEVMRMNIFKWRKDTVAVREINTEVMNIGLDALAQVEGTPESRKHLADEMKKLVDSNAEMETLNDKTEYAVGRFHGVLLGGGAAIGGYAIGRIIAKLIKR